MKCDNGNVSKSTRILIYIDLSALDKGYFFRDHVTFCVSHFKVDTLTSNVK